MGCPIARGGIPHRTCVGCGRRRSQSELVRFSGGPAGLTVRLEGGGGRGAYLCPEASCLGRAIARRALQRALRMELGPWTVRILGQAIHEAVLETVRRIVGVARRAGGVVTGWNAIARAMQGGRVRLVLVSRDDLPRVNQDLRAAVEREGIPVVTVSSCEALASTLGGPSPDAIGLSDGGFAEDVLRTLRYRIPGMDGERAPEVGEKRGMGGGSRG